MNGKLKATTSLKRKTPDFETAESPVLRIQNDDYFTYVLVIHPHTFYQNTFIRLPFSQQISNDGIGKYIKEGDIIEFLRYNRTAKEYLWTLIGATMEREHPHSAGTYEMRTIKIGTHAPNPHPETSTMHSPLQDIFDPTRISKNQTDRISLDLLYKLEYSHEGAMEQIVNAMSNKPGIPATAIYAKSKQIAEKLVGQDWTEENSATTHDKIAEFIRTHREFIK